MSRRIDPTDWMWAEACDLIDEAERLHRRFFRLGVAGQAVALWEPPVDMFEDEREFVVVVAMPGVPANRVQVVLEPGAVLVRGQRPLPFTGARHAVRQLEIPYGAFERRIPIPRIQLELSAPELLDGCLVLRLRKKGQGL